MLWSITSLTIATLPTGVHRSMVWLILRTHTGLTLRAEGRERFRFSQKYSAIHRSLHSSHESLQWSHGIHRMAEWLMAASTELDNRQCHACGIWLACLTCCTSALSQEWDGQQSAHPSWVWTLSALRILAQTKGSGLPLIARVNNKVYETFKTKQRNNNNMFSGRGVELIVNNIFKRWST